MGGNEAGGGACGGVSQGNVDFGTTYHFHLVSGVHLEGSLPSVRRTFILRQAQDERGRVPRSLVLLIQPFLQVLPHEIPFSSLL